jgi:putative lipoic acid-binding regulatory protein
VSAPGEPPASFPCALPIKVFGRNASGFRDAALATVSAHCPDHEVTEQLSRNGTFVSLTITVQAESRQQMDAVYSALSAMQEVLLVL